VHDESKEGGLVRAIGAKWSPPRLINKPSSLLKNTWAFPVKIFARGDQL